MQLARRCAACSASNVRPGRHVEHHEAALGHVEHREVGVDALHRAERGQRIGAAVHQLRTCRPSWCAPSAPTAAWRRRRGPSRRRPRARCRSRLVAQLAMSPFSATWNAPSTQRSRCPPRIIEKLSAWWQKLPPCAQRDILLAGIDQPGVDLVLRRRRPHAEHAVLGMEDHLALQRHVVGDRGRDADAEIDVPALRDVARHAGGHLDAAERLEVGRRRYRASLPPAQKPVGSP